MTIVYFYVNIVKFIVCIGEHVISFKLVVFHIVFIFFANCKLANVNVCKILNEEINQFKPNETHARTYTPTSNALFSNRVVV